MRSILVYISFFVLGVVGLRSCYLDAFCEYKSVFVIADEEKESRINFYDSLSIYQNLTIESHLGNNGNQVMAAYVDFSHYADSITVATMSINISCIDNPEQDIRLSHVITYVDPLIPEYIDYVRAPTFDELPTHYKTINLKREPWTTFRFYFETEDVDLGEKYQLQITGTAVHKGQLIHFKKNIVAKRRKQFVPIQMMT